MSALYKAVRPDGTDFHTGTIDYGAALLSGEIVRHPTSSRIVPGDAATYLSASVEPADCTGMEWPCRLLLVEPVGEAVECRDLPNKRAVLALRVVGEVPAWQALGPNGEAVAALIDRAGQLTGDEATRLAAARAAAWDAAWAAARDAARDAAGAAAWDAAWDAAWAAAGAAAGAAAVALAVRDLISLEDFEVLTRPWVSVMGATWEEEA